MFWRAHTLRKQLQVRDFALFGALLNGLFAVAAACDAAERMRSCQGRLSSISRRPAYPLLPRHPAASSETNGLACRLNERIGCIQRGKTSPQQRDKPDVKKFGCDREVRQGRNSASIGIPGKGTSTDALRTNG